MQTKCYFSSSPPPPLPPYGRDEKVEEFLWLHRVMYCYV